MSRTHPAVSVVMAVFNGQQSLADAITSIQSQTLRNWELVVVNDASVDSTGLILNELSSGDQRIRVFNNHSNMGLAASLNFGWRKARAPLIARMDSDDISLPQRLETQYAAFQRQKDLSVLGSAVFLRERGGKIIGRATRPATHDELFDRILYEVPFFHPTVMMRRGFLELAGGYDTQFRRAQDYELWSRCITKARYANLSEALLTYTRPDKYSLQSIYWGTRALYRAAKLYGNSSQKIICPLRFLCAAVMTNAGLHTTWA